MNEELQNALAELVNSTNRAKDFIVAEAPEVVQQLLLWHGVYKLALFAIGLLLLVSIPFQIKFIIGRLPEKIKEGEPDNWFWFDFNRIYKTASFDPSITLPGGAACMTVAILIVIQLLVVCGALNLEWLQIYLAPKVWLIEYVAQLTK